MRLIDADALKPDIREEFNDFPARPEFGNRVVVYGVSMAKIADAPTIEIVRCKECKWLRYCETEDLDLYIDCDKPDGGGIPKSEEWFCADGERSE